MKCPEAVTVIQERKRQIREEEGRRREEMRVEVQLVTNAQGLQICNSHSAASVSLKTQHLLTDPV